MKKLESTSHGGLFRSGFTALTMRMQAVKSSPAIEPDLVALDADEVDFLDAAFRQILWESRDGRAIEASTYGRYVDRNFGSDPSIVSTYRSAISTIQAHCVRLHRARFQHLPAWRQLEVLAVHEYGDPDGAMPDLFLLMINHAAEAYFDRVSSSGALVTWPSTSTNAHVRLGESRNPQRE
jgi:hypothetical protein